MRRRLSKLSYLEAVGERSGRPGLHGLLGVHVHMSNTLNTPIEAFEYAYPLRIVRYQLRDGSGGVGSARGGDGLVREIAFETPNPRVLFAETML
jgi:N-methylhydantoinase B